MSVPVILPPLYAYGQVGRSFRLNLHASGSPAPTWSATNLPSGLSIHPLITGSDEWLIDGFPTLSGLGQEIHITATNVDGSDSEDYLFNIFAVGVPFYTGPKGFAMMVGVPFSRALPWTNSPTSYGFTPFLPNGITINSITGELSGTPTEAGEFPEVFINAVGAGGFGENVISISVTDPSGGGDIPVITSALTAEAIVGSLFTYQITATNNPTRFSILDGPVGMGVHGVKGVIEWTPTVSGAVTVSIFAQNLSGISDPATLTITVTGDGGGGGGGGGMLPPPPDISGPGNFAYTESNPFAEDIRLPCSNVQKGAPPSPPKDFRIFVSGTPGDTTAHASWTQPDLT